ncbi:hypothetical protein A2765_03320 [Candidatus Kaiserbacteria bacterium RIFCSPHIGHO2_01_FULL_56_24]|uniref:SpoVT-AbrB domain-containing protein n=1 Tax=Candidatus Kaiserbacteria bacterium RIFCSPHIGHO2_01_FULL_56_24 TaxID=1798487 RepID=A0A1F6DB53_9BACT|nr:MAG: hypothetical protein A2765_03320 [Candidatus Kaiserbacteria bacterium RIFCSPHIGHO2_01_FULL_56_24]
MTQKVLKVGSSAAVTISKKSLAELGIEIGDQVNVVTDAERQVVSIRPLKSESKRMTKITKLTLDFVNRYREDMEALANE